MASKSIFFKPTHNQLAGYYIPVRNDWNYQIMKRHISEKEKEAYKQEFGEKILSDNDFFKWWRKLQPS